MSDTALTRRERQRQATLDEIVGVARELLREPSGLSLRAVAQKMGITAPALYRYVDNVQDLQQLVADDIDEETGALLEQARDSQPDDDPAAQIIVAAIVFRRWALAHREEFGLVFANPLVAHADPEDLKEQKVGLVFTDLLIKLWRKYDFPVPALDQIDPAVVATFEDPHIPAKLENIPEHAKGLLWVFMQSWVALYGTVTLEVFGHCDPRVIESGALFRAMLAQQSEQLGISHELPRLLPLIEEQLSR
ncbi:MAG: WHG domain-containing protein [Actinomycetota bacterium]|nr:WHG domain-containing protein [Actinomycetota bacterium]